MPEPTRSTRVESTTTVRHVAHPFTRELKNPPSLGHLREFVAACEGLPDDEGVYVSKGDLDEGGRYTMTFSVSVVTEVAPRPDAAAIYDRALLSDGDLRGEGFSDEEPF